MNPLRAAWLRRLLQAPLAPYLLLLTLLTLPALGPLFAPGYFFDAHDGRHSVFYLIQFDAGLRDGALWPRWAMHHLQGYGYPTFIIQAPLGFFFTEIFVIFGAGYTLAAKFAWAFGLLLSGWGMAVLVHHWLKRTAESSGSPVRHGLAAMIAGLLYVYIPYHLADMYVRAALNDTLLLAWFPWVVLAFDRLIDLGMAPGWPRRLALAAAALGGCLLTHTFSLISFTPLLMVFVIFRLTLAYVQDRDRRGLARRTLLAATGGVLALCLIATFLLPLLLEAPLLEQQVYVSNTYNFRNHFVQWGQFFSPFWGFGFSDDPAGANDGMGFQIGAVALILAIIGAFIVLRESEPRWMRRAYLGFLASLTLILLYLMTPSAAGLWQSIPPLAVIQFPWRLLALGAFSLAALGGMVAPALIESGTPPNHRPQQAYAADGSAILLVFVIILASWPYIDAHLAPIEAWREDGRAIFRFEQEHPDMIAYTQWVKEQYTTSPMSDDYAADTYREDYGPDGPLTRLAIIQGNGAIISQYSRGASAGGVVRMDDPGTVRIHVTYFPGWRVRVDGEEAVARISDPYGLIEVDVPAGEHHIDARMGTTPVRTTGTIISWATVLLLAGMAWWPQRTRPVNSADAVTDG